MSYILVLMFTYSRYQHDASIRIYADDYLIDELSLTDNISLKTVKYNNMPIETSIQKYDRDAELSRVLILPEKLFLFEIQEKYLNNKIRFEVENDYTNYTNGFMTKFSYITFHHVFLIPKCLLHAKNWVLPEGMQRKDYLHGNIFPTKPEYKDLIIKTCSNTWSDNFLRHERGGSFDFEITLSRKHNIIHVGKLSPGKIWMSLELPEILCAFKKLNIST